MVKVHKLVAAIATTFTLSTTGAYALNMGDISWKSSYGQPLNAKIELSDTAGLSASNIKVSLATNAEFTNAGIEYSNELAKLVFTPIITDNGKAYIQVTSKTPIKEPYLNFLVNISFQGNKLSKEYTLLMDLPAQGNVNPTAQPTKKATNIPKAVSTTTNTTADNYRIQKGDTLWSVAEKLHGANSAAKAATAIYKKNPKAFIKGSANQLIAGYQLKVPSDQEVRAIPVAEANSFMQATKTPGATNFVASNTTVPAKTTKADKKQADQLTNKLKTSEQQLTKARLENDELSTKLEQLQTEITQLDQVSKLKDEQIKSIQSQVAKATTEQQPAQQAATEQQPAQQAAAEQQPAQQTATEQQPTQQAAAEQQPAQQTATEQQPAQQTATEQQPTQQAATEQQPAQQATTEQQPAQQAATEQQSAEQKQAEQQAAQKKQAEQQAAAARQRQAEEDAQQQQAEEDALIFGFDKATLIKIGGGVLLILCIVALVLRRKKAAEQVTEVDLNHLMLDTPDDSANQSEQTTATDDDSHNVDSPLTDLQDENILDKADIYLAYNRYNEAKELLLEALKTDPANSSYRLKLLEVYGEQRDSTGFEAEAQELLVLDPLAQQKVDTLKTRYFTLAENSNEFSAPKISPLSEQIETTQTPLTEQAVNSDEDVFSFEGKPEEEDPLAKANANFELDTINEEPKVKEQPLFSNAEEPDYDFNADSPVYEFGHEEPKIAEAAKEEDFKFDLGIGQTSATQEKLPEEKTAEGWNSFVDSFAQPADTTASVEEHPSTEHLDEADTIEKDQVTTKLELVHAYIEMNDTEGAHDLLNEILQEGNEAQQAEARKLLASIEGEAPLHTATETPAIPEIEQPLIIAPVTSSVETDSSVETPPTAVAKPTPSVVESSTATQENITPLNISSSAAELDLGFELPPEDEVSTKLELAHAYIDMGDTSGARDILEEVLKEGTTEQKQQAEQLIANL